MSAPGVRGESEKAAAGDDNPATALRTIPAGPWGRAAIARRLTVGLTKGLARQPLPVTRGRDSRRKRPQPLLRQTAKHS
jgi:hypothetical protein